MTTDDSIHQKRIWEDLMKNEGTCKPYPYPMGFGINRMSPCYILFFFQYYWCKKEVPG